MKKLLLLLAGVGIAAVPAVTFAAYVAAGQSAALPAAMATSTNAYLVGATVDATTPVNGDLIAAGGTVVISSNVKQDILAAGGTINMIGASAEDARIAGGNITIDGKFSGELMAGGGNVIVTSNSTIVKDSYLAAGTLDFAGAEHGNLTIVGGTIHINGKVDGDLLIRRAGTVTIGAGAVIKGNLEYSAPQQATIEQGAQIGGQTTFHQVAATATQGNASGVWATIIGFWFLAKLLVLLTAAYLIWYLRRNDSIAIIEAVQTHFGKELFRGFAFMILVPVAVIILAVTLIGAIPAIVLLLAYILLLVLAIPTAIIMTASILMALFKKNMTSLRWYHILIGAIVYELLAIIPFIGWIAGCLVYLVALGALVNVFRKKFQAS